MSTSRFAIGLLLAAALPWPGEAQDAIAALDAASNAMGTGTLQSLRYTGTGSNNSLGQAYRQRGRVAPVHRQEVHRARELHGTRDAPGDRAHRRSGSPARRRRRAVYGRHWPRRHPADPGDIIQNQNSDGRTEIGALNIWLTPHGFIKGAIASGNAKVAGETRTQNAGRVHGIRQKHESREPWNERNLVERVATVIDGGFTGDTALVAELQRLPELRGRAGAAAHRAESGRLPCSRHRRSGRASRTARRLSRFAAHKRARGAASARRDSHREDR